MFNYVRNSCCKKQAQTLQLKPKFPPTTPVPWRLPQRQPLLSSVGVSFCSSFFMNVCTYMCRIYNTWKYSLCENIQLKIHHIVLVSILDLLVPRIFIIWFLLHLVKFICGHTLQTSFSLSGSHTFRVLALHVFFLFWPHDRGVITRL